MIPRVIIDTNIWISGLFWGGVPFQILEKFYRRLIIPCFSRETFNEWNDKVGALAQITGKLELYLKDKRLIEKNSLFVFPQEKIDICRDPKDNKFLEAATASAANFLISGDRDLITLKRIKETHIITPAQFLKLFP